MAIVANIARLPLATGAIALTVLLNGCTATSDTASSAPPSTTTRLVADPTLAGSTVECLGSLRFDTAHDGAGQSQCRNGDRVPFTIHTDDHLSPGLSCTYTLSYSDPARGTGQIVCNDGSSGDLTFEDRDTKHGLATARMKDGREVKLTYTRT